MNHIEAMKLALDALQGSGYYDTKQQREAITALRQAIQEAEKQEQWTPDDMAHRPGGLSMEDEPDLSEQGRNRSAVLVNNIQAMVDAGLPFLDALETTLKVYDHPTKPQEDTAYRPGGLSMEQKPVAWWNPDESGLAFQKLRGDWQPLYAAPVHTIDINQRCVDETWKNKYEPVPCKHKRYSVDAYEQTGTCYDCGAQGRMRFVVYETTPPKREWQGLTDEEIFDVIRSLCADNETAEMLIDISMDEYRAIEAKLKEKNN